MNSSRSTRRNKMAKGGKRRDYVLLAMLRHLLWLILLGVFIWQAYYSINKYFKGDTSNTFQRINAETLEFPTISFCPMSKSTADRDENENDTMADDASFSERFAVRQKADNILAYVTPGEHEGHALYGLEELPQNWSRRYTVSPFDLNVIECLSFEPSGSVRPGYSSAFQTFVHTKVDEHTLVFVNQPGQSLLVPTILFGRDIAKLPDLLSTQIGHIQYQISVTEQEKLPTADRPCHKDSNFSIEECVTEYYESDRQCHMLWRANNKRYSRMCDSNEDYKAYQELHSFFIHASEHDIYNKTGCFYACKFRTYVLRTIIHETGNASDDSWYNLNAWFFLAPGGYVFEKEILVYDGYDLIGNIGGFLGLFLGASVLSMFDNIRDRVLNMKYFFT